MAWNWRSWRLDSGLGMQKPSAGHHGVSAEDLARCCRVRRACSPEDGTSPSILLRAVSFNISDSLGADLREDFPF